MSLEFDVWDGKVRINIRHGIVEDRSTKNYVVFLASYESLKPAFNVFHVGQWLTHRYRYFNIISMGLNLEQFI